MKKPSFAFFFAAILFFSTSLTGAARAQQPGPTYQLFFPLIYNVGHIYLPMITVPAPPQWDGPVGGTITAVVYDFTNPRIVYAASFNGGMYKSTDGGESWFQINKGLPTVQINTLSIDPTDPVTLYAGPYRYGVYKTTDGGATWTNVSKGLKGQPVVYSIAVDPQNPRNLYAAARDYNLPSFNPPWLGTLYKSTDSGASWTPSLSNAGGSAEQDWVYSIAIDPFKSSTIYAAGHETGMYRSKDSGKTWQSINTGLGDKTTRSVIADPKINGLLYTATWHRAGTYKSVDFGGHWVNYPNGSSGAKFLYLTLDPKQTSILFAGTSGSGILRSTNSGTSWSGTGTDGQYYYSVAVNPVNSSTVLAGGDGIWKSTDRGASWHQVHWGFTSSGTFTDLSTFPDLLVQ